MPTKRDGWGFAIFLLAPLMIGCAVFLLSRISLQNTVHLMTLIPLVGIVLSLFSFFLAHLSYPRVHNVRVFILCYTSGLLGMCGFIPQLFDMGRAPSVNTILFLSQVNLLVVLLIPPKAKYRRTKLFSWFLTGAELLFICMYLFLDMPSGMRHILELQHESVAWAMVFWPLLILVLSFILAGKQHHLGGVITGSTYFWAVSVLIHRGGTPLLGSNSVLHSASLLYLINGIMVHWFSRMEHRVTYDPLLQIYNRNFCSRIIEEQSRMNTLPPFGIAMIDIDHFKRVNDTWGHQSGDRVLTDVAQIIQREIVPFGTLCRYGGEELAAFFPRMVSGDILPLMEKVRKSVSSLKVPVGKKKNISVTISCGVAHRKSTSQSVVHVIESADRALYRAKEAGRNRVIGASPAGSKR
jgi:diguanylate cyclase (GGDEF)-like protein